MKYAFLLGAISALTVSTSSAVVVWADDFSTARASAPNPYNYPGSVAGDDWLANANGNTVSVIGGVFNINDTVSSATGDALFVVPTTQWTGIPVANGDTVRISYSIRVTSLVAGGGASVPRFSVVQNPGNTGSALGGGGSLFTIGFGYGAFSDGDASNSDLAFYTSQDPATAPGTGVTSAIGLSAGAWAPGFDFGNYLGTAAADNDTNDQFYRVVINLTEGSTAVTGSITNLANTEQSTTFSATAAAQLNFKSSDGVDGIRFATGQGGTSNHDLDDIMVEILPVPEPSSALLVAACGALGLLRRRRA